MLLTRALVEEIDKVEGSRFGWLLHSDAFVMNGKANRQLSPGILDVVSESEGNLRIRRARNIRKFFSRPLLSSLQTISLLKHRLIEHNGG